MANGDVKQVRISSLERFRKLTDDMKKTVHVEAVAELNRQAALLKETIQAVAPVAPVEGGELKTSVRLIPDRSKDTIVRVVAGGELTTRPSISSTPFDYARADEFGTQKMAAQPFFFPTYRLMKKRIIAAMKRRITRNIKKYSAEQGGANV
jgi:HK97 gp10 family phage protein